MNKEVAFLFSIVCNFYIYVWVLSRTIDLVVTWDGLCSDSIWATEINF